MNKKIFGFALGALLFMLSAPADAQQPTKAPTIGFLFPGSASTRDRIFSNEQRAGSAFLTLVHPVIGVQQKRILEFAAKNRLPGIHADKEWADSGGLMSYGPDRPDLFRRSAIYVDKILKGARPAELPVEQSMKFEFVINLKTAKQMGLTIVPNVLARAHRVIK